ncbi:fucolectin-6-like [Acanthopagrus schlegelii]
MMNFSVFMVLLLLGTCSAGKYQNVALRGVATQSARYGNEYGAAYNAIDGNRESDYRAGSCSHTTEMRNPWWRVDLLESYIITSITIVNRDDCCKERINGLEVHIGNSVERDGFENPVVARIADIGRAKMFSQTFTDRVEGRYVTLVIPGPRRIITVCEVEIYGYRSPSGENLALQGKATQSSLFQFGFANNAIDSSQNSEWGDGSCSHTSNDVGPWWRLDLRKSYKVFTVKITNKKSNPERLNGAEIRIGDSIDNNGNNNTMCDVIQSIEAGATTEFQCPGLDGRYVNIVIPGKEEFLSLCEVEVYGSRLD